MNSVTASSDRHDMLALLGAILAVCLLRGHGVVTSLSA
jgi:hypothetical protein